MDMLRARVLGEVDSKAVPTGPAASGRHSHYPRASAGRRLAFLRLRAFFSSTSLTSESYEPELVSRVARVSRSSLLIFTESFLITVLTCLTLTLTTPTGSGGPQAGYSSVYNVLSTTLRCYIGVLNTQYGCNTVYISKGGYLHIKTCYFDRWMMVIQHRLFTKFKTLSQRSRGHGCVVCRLKNPPLGFPGFRSITAHC